MQFTVVSPSGNVEPDGGVHVTGTFTPRRSLAVGVNVTAPPPGPVAEATIVPDSVSTGGVVTLTCTVNVPLEVFPKASVAVQFTVVVPTGNVAPAGGVHPTGRSPSNMSVAEAV